MLKKIPYGISDFQELIESNCYFVDKSLLIHEILDNAAKVIVLPRPRRFGKTLNMTMLRYFLEENEEDRSTWFKDLKIASIPDCMEQQGKHPVIFLTLKDLKERSWESCFNAIKFLLGGVYRNCKILEDSAKLNQFDRKYIDKIASGECSAIELKQSLYVLSELIVKITGKKPFILIDEYDTPIHSGYLSDYYEEVIDFFQGFLGRALKDNPYLNKSVITGILRVSRESIFSDLNNLNVCTLLEKKYSDHFGFLEEEVKEMLDYYSQDDCFEDVREWYNGYLFGETTIYNPWSVISYIHTGEKKAEPFWLNTSSNKLIQNLISDRMAYLEKDLEALLAGETIECIIDKQIVFPDLDRDAETIWNFLLFSGYLKASHYRKKEDLDLYDLEIPNREVRTLFRKTILKWMSDTMGSQASRKMREDLLEGRVSGFLDELHKLVQVSLSFHDTQGNEPEIAYHMLILGMVAHVSSDYHIRSNRESGLGRYDVALEPKDPNQLGYVFEFKQLEKREEKKIAKSKQFKGKSKEEIAELLQEKEEAEINKAKREALTQIQSKEYATDMQTHGVNQIAGIAMVFRGKELHTQFEILTKFETL